MTTTFTLSIIKDVAGHSFQHGYHLGTDERLARQIAVTKFHERIEHKLPVFTVALMRGNKMVDCYDGVWASQRDDYLIIGDRC